MLEYFRHNVQLQGNERVLYPRTYRFCPPRFNPFVAREHRQGRVLSTAIPMCVLELSYDTIPQDSQSLSEIISPGMGMQRIVIFVLL